MNAALFAALAWTTGQPALALAGFLALTSVLSLNFNAERLSRGATRRAGGVGRTRDGRSPADLRLFSTRRRTGSQRRSSPGGRRSHGPTRVSLLANLGMSTQLAAFGLLIAVGHPLAFAWLAVAEFAVIALALLPRRAPSRQEEIA